MARHQNHGLRKTCDCPRRSWPKCRHSWYLNFKPKGVGPHYRISLDKHAGKHLERKEDARAEAERIKTAIRDGLFRVATVTSPAPVAAQDITFSAFVKTYTERVLEPSGNVTWASDAARLRQAEAFALPAGGTLGGRAIGAVTADDVEAFVQSLRAAGRAASSRNHTIQNLKAAFRWAARKGYLSKNPLADAELRREKSARRVRRLVPDVFDKDGNLKTPGEERRLLAVAGPQLQRLIIGALETCARRGELLALQWRNVDMKRRELTIDAATCKTREHRTIPISARLAAVLELAKLGPDGKELPGSAFVFGNEAGEKAGNPTRAWETAVLKAHGHAPEWVPGKHTLTPASRAAFRAIGLHLHDMRHEGASRLLEAGWPLHHVKDMLGHADISTTDVYLNATRAGLADSMRKSDEARQPLPSVAHDAESEHRPPCNEDGEADAKPLLM